MKIILVMVTSVNGKITQGENPDVTAWTSPEDQKHFRSIITAHSLIIMGRRTYEAGAKRRKPTPGKLRIVMTRKPEELLSQTIAGQFEFTNESPKKLIKRLEKLGYKEALLAGGGEINAQFLDAGLVSELYLTIEPILFGEGKPLLSPIPLALPMELLEVKKLNPRGTLLARYRILATADGK